MTILSLDSITQNTIKDPTTGDKINRSVGFDVSYLNKTRSYDFNEREDVFVDKRGINIGLNINIPSALKRKIGAIKILVSYRQIKNINNISSKNNKIIEEFMFNINDYYDISKKQKIIENGFLSVKTFANCSNSNIVKIEDSNVSMLKKVIDKKASLGELFESNENIYDVFIQDEQNKNHLDISINSKFISKTFSKEIEFKKVYIKIIELTKFSHNNIRQKNWQIYSAHSYTIKDVRRIYLKASKIKTERNNMLSALSFTEGNGISSNISIINERNDKYSLLTKKSSKSIFKNVTKDRFSNKQETVEKLNNPNPAIYRVIDGNKKLKDVFVGDVKKWFFDSIPTAHVFSLSSSIKIIIKDIPDDYLFFYVYRWEGNNKSSKIEMILNKSVDINLGDNFLVLTDESVEHTKIYKYQIKFITANDTEILTNITNNHKFIKPSGAFSIFSEIEFDEQQDKNVLKIKTSVPSTDFDLLFKNINENFPKISEDDIQTISENYSYLTYANILKLNKRTGSLKKIETIAINNNEAIYNLNNNDIDENCVFICEMFSSSLSHTLSMLKNSVITNFDGFIKNISSYESFKDNFVSKNFSFYALDEGTLTYGKSLANMTGSVIESFKTGNFSMSEQLVEEELTQPAFDSYKTFITNRNIPAINIVSQNDSIDSFLIIVSSFSGISFRVEKASFDDTSFTFYDTAAQYDFIDEIVDYYVIPVYNNYIIDNIYKIDTVLCSKNNFKVI
jgi:hypothetical protein